VRFALVVRTKSVFQPIERADGYRILITRFYPRGVERTHFHEWVSCLSPSPDLLFDYKEHRISWESFMDSFIVQLKNDLDSLEAISALHKWSRMNDLTLLCFEKSGLPCHRHLVRDIVENPSLVGISLETENADYHKGIAMQRHVADQEASVVSALA